MRMNGVIIGVLLMSMVMLTAVNVHAESTVTITDLSYTPTAPTPDDVITVKVKVTSDADIKTVTLRYMACAEDTCGIPSTVPMVLSGDYYTASIGPFNSNAVHVTLDIDAEDSSGATGHIEKEIEFSGTGNSSGSSDTSNNSGNSSIPGYDSMLLISSMFVAMVAYTIYIKDRW